MLTVLFWIMFGGLVGLVASIVQEEKPTKRRAAYIILGMLGGLLGGYAGGRVSAEAIEYNASMTGMMFAIMGAITFVALAGLSGNKHSE
jgi:uncharacterized membrane protein YeaQ/YmgE (transglycosylase-associated protein family)